METKSGCLECLLDPNGCDENHDETPDKIWLVPDGRWWLWCDGPSPTAGQPNHESVNYIKAATLKSLVIELTNCDIATDDGEVSGIFCPSELLEKLASIVGL